jgi:AcrR family transcriptional regulator
VAGALLEDEGRGAVTLRELGRRAGLSRSAPYRHFDGKEDLLAAVAAEGLRDPLRHRDPRQPPPRSRAPGATKTTETTDATASVT